VLNTPDMANRAIFYFRDPAWLQRISPQRRPDFLEVDPVRQGRLAALKERIKTSELACRVNYPDPAILGQWVLEDLTVAINQMYPPEEAPGPLDRDAAEHEAFARSRAVVEVRPGVFSGVYIGRPEYLARLDEHAAGDGSPLVVLGASGSGKSALLANWALRYRREHPDVLVVLHFIGATPYSADWAAMLRRVMGELKRHFAIDQEIPDKLDVLRAAFANWLSMAAARGRVVLVLDALNQLEDCDGALDLVWLPPVVTGNMRLVLSTLPGRPLADLRKRQWPTLEVAPLEPAERQTLIIDYLAQYTKQLSPAQVHRIAGAAQAANPLYLRALLDELRVFGFYELLDRRIDYYLAANDIPNLYDRILERWEADYQQERRALVCDAMTALWASRRGLGESELLELLGSGGQPLPRAIWSPLSLAAGQSLVVRSGLSGFFHDYLREAVRRRYLPNASAEKEAHLRLADYFEALDPSRRRIEELPWQLAEATAWQRLFDLLSDLSFFQAAWATDLFEVEAYWAQIEGQSSFRMLDAYRLILDAPERWKDENLLWRLGVLLAEAGHPQEAYGLREYLVKYFRETNDRTRLQQSLGGLALILHARGELDAAMALNQEQERICRELGDKLGLRVSLQNRANIHYDRGELDTAVALYKEVERMCDELGDKHALAGVLGNQGVILEDRGDLDGAMKLYKQKEQICREVGDKARLQASLDAQARLLYNQSDLSGAIHLYKQQEKICRDLGNKAGLERSLAGQGMVLYVMGDLDGATALFKEEEQICRELGEMIELQRSLGHQALVVQSRHDFSRAMQLLEEQSRICRILGNKSQLADSLLGKANVLNDQGKIDEALQVYAEHEEICRELGQREALWRSLYGQAHLLFFKANDPDRALAKCQEAIHILEETHIRPEYLTSARTIESLIKERLPR
jgi:tetratricopeptide (TPR) repeat protein